MTRRHAGVALVAGIALLAAACGGGSGFSPPQATATGGGGELRVLAASSGTAETQALTQAIDAFNASGQGKAKLEIATDLNTQLTTALAGGNPPDVFYGQVEKIYDLVKADALAPVGDKVGSPVYPNLKAAFTVNGTYYCPPKDFSTLALQVNDTMLAQAGVTPPKTWAELRTAAEKLTTGGRVGLVMGDELLRVLPFMLQNGGYVLSKDLTKATANTPQNAEALTYLKEMIDKGWVKSAKELGAGWPGEAFGKQQAAMTLEGNWILGAMAKDYPSVKYSSVELPAGPKGKGTLSFTVCWAVAKATKNLNGAVALVKFLTSDKEQLALTEGFGPMPANPALRDKWLQKYPQAQAYIAGAQYATTPVFPSGFKPVLDETNTQIQRFFKGQATPSQVLQSFDSAAASVLGG